MTDVFTPGKRSEVMSKIRGRGNSSTEGKFISLLRENSITGWRRGYKLYGHPDFVFPRLRVAVFVDGCFWHMCPLHCQIPDHNREFWLKKLRGTVSRDKEVDDTLAHKGWRVLRIWEHELLKKHRPELLAKSLPVLTGKPVGRMEKRV